MAFLRFRHGAVLRSFVALLATLLVAALGPGCASEEEIEGEEISAAVCAAESTDVYLRVRKAGALFAGKDLGAELGTLPEGTTVLRKVTEELRDDAPYSHVVVKTGPLKGKTGWITLSALEISKPSTGGGTCSSGFDPQSRASAAERAVSQADPLPLVALKSTMQCVVGLGEGTGAGATDLVEGIGTLLVGAGKLTVEVWRRQRLALLYLLGSDEAGRELARTVSDDKARLKALLGIVTHALPALHAYLSEQWLFYQALTAEYKARYLCKIIGRLAVEVVADVVAPSLLATHAAKVVRPVEAMNRAVSRIADIPGRIGDSPIVQIADRSFEGTKLLPYWERLQGSLAALRSARTLPDRKRLIREISDDINVPFKGLEGGDPDFTLKVGRGNCGNAALSTMLTIASGHLSCTLPYLDESMSEYDKLRESLVKVGGNIEDLYFDDYPDIDEFLPKLEAKLGEGQMALFLSEGAESGHATIAVKLNGKIYNINNQGWEKGLGFADDELQSLGGWMDTWGQLHPEQGNFYAFVTELKVPCE